MRRKLEEVRETLSKFVDQRDNLLLVVSLADREIAYVLKTLEGMDQTGPSDLYLIFAEPFTDGPAYATAILKNLRAQGEVAKVLLEQRGEEPFPPLPERCDDEAAPPGARLRAAIDHVASLVPSPGGHRVIWGFLPLQIADQEGYARLIGEFVMWSGLEPWMRGLRVVARDDRARPFLSPALRKKKAPGVLLYDLDMSPEALNDALVKEAADRSAPVADRMQALMQLAGIDHAYKRYPEAIEKYKLLYGYYEEHKAPAMQALVLQGVGDALLRMGNREGAKVKYHQGLALAMQTHSLPVLLNLTYAIGDLSLELKSLREAEGFFGLSAQIAGKMQNPFVKADALEKQGIAKDRTGDEVGAVVAWRDAAALSKTFAYHERQRSTLERLIRAYRSMALDEERRACEAELETAEQAMKEAARETREHPLRSTG